MCSSTDAANLTGTVASARISGSYTGITGVGTLTAGTLSTGVTVQAANVTVSGQFPGTAVAVVANASGSPSATFGVMKADGTTIQCASGLCSAVGGVATSITVGTTTVGSASGSNQVLTTGTVVTGTGTLANVATTALVFGTGTLSLSGNLTTTGAFNPTFAIPASVTYTFPSVAATLSYTLATGAKALATSAIASGACSSAQTDTATGAATTDAAEYTFASDPTGVTGYSPSVSGMLTVIPYITSNTMNLKVCNNTSASITPGPITVNWKIVR
jgi:hypothetical protein